MGELQIELTKLIGSKELSFGCEINARWGIKGKFLRKENLSEEVIFFYSERENIESLQSKFVEIIGHPATLSDFQIWLESKWLEWEQKNKYTDKFGEAKIMIWWGNWIYLGESIEYDPSKYLIDQPEENLKAIIEFIKSYN